MFSKTTEYALRAAVSLCDAHSRNASAQAVADATRVPVGYMSKVLQTLAQAGIVQSQRGPGGGFCLSREPREITMLDVVQAVEPIARVPECPLNLPEHCDALCPLHQKLDDMAACAEKTLSETTLADLIKENVVPLGMSIVRDNS